MSKFDAQEYQRVVPSLTYQKAGWLDIPLIFELLQEGAETGSFGNMFVERYGSVKLFGYVLRRVATQCFQFTNINNHAEWHMISLAGGQTVGFLSVRKNSRHDNKHLDLLAICPAYRNQGIGSNVLEHVMSGLPNSGQLIVHCTKYARSMQHILKRHKFKRNVKFDVPTLEEYRSQSVSVDPS